MKSKVADKVALVIDYGNYVSLAQRLARDFKKVYYCSMWQTAYPKWNQYCVGMGVEEIERVDEFWSIWDEVDIICVPDLYMGTFQDWAVRMGKKVWGCRQGEDMEIYRDDFKEMLEKMNLKVNKYVRIEGITDLKKHLKGKSNKYIKVNMLRGNIETFHYIDADLSISRMKSLEHELGAYGEHAVFIVEDPIENAVEIGYDGYSIDGKFPAIAMTGVEIKDAGYAGGLVDYENLPKCLKDINKKFAGIFAGAGYKCNFSNEVRYQKNGDAYFIDFTARIPSPPGDLMMEIYTNFSEAIWDMAHGVVPEMEYKHKFGVQLVIKSGWAEEEPQAIYFDEKYKDFIKIKNLMITDGVCYYVPVIEMSQIGSVVGVGDTIEEAIAMVEKICETIKGDSLELNVQALHKSVEQIEKLKTFGITLF